MSMTEDRLRAAARAVATTVAERPVPPLDLSRTPGRLPVARSRRSRLTTVLAPVTAAAAVLALIAALVALSASHSRDSGPSQGSLLAQAPRYYMALVPIGRNPVGPQKAEIRDTVTGATLATILPPKPFGTFDSVTGAADDRTFVLSAAKGTSYLSGSPTRFILARFNPARGVVVLTTLRVPEVPAGALMTGMALSPSGDELATAVLTGADVQVSVYSLRTGAVRTWQGTGTIGDGPYDTNSISWSRSGTLAFNWLGNSRFVHGRLQLSSEDGVWLLNTSTPGGDLLADSRLAVRQDQPDGLGLAWDGILAPDGQRIVAATMGLTPVSDSPPATPPQTITARPSTFRRTLIRGEFEEFSAATGRAVRTLLRVASPVGTFPLVWSNPSGSVLVVGAPAASGQQPVFGVLSGNGFTPIPGAPPVTQSAVTLAF
jgi:hypothetical protein